MRVRNYLCLIALFFFAQVGVQFCLSQTPAPQAAANTGVLRGTVMDPSGAAISGASVILTPSAVSSNPITTKTDGTGAYEFKGLAPGQYSLSVVAQGFSVYENDNVAIGAQPLRVNISMQIEV